jgi:hypothetical protein
MSAFRRHPEVSPAMNSLLAMLHGEGARLFGAEDVRLEPLSFQRRESSEVSRVRVTTPFGVRYVFAKICGPRPGETDMAATQRRFRRDCEISRRMFDAMRSTEDLASVEPIATYDDLLGMVTTEAPGVLLNVLIARSAAWPVAAGAVAKVELALRRVARWTARFQHVATTSSPLKIDLDATRLYLDIRLQKLVALPRASFDAADRRDVLEYFDRLAETVDPADADEVAVHGDIVPSNVIAAEDRVTVLDFGMTATGSRYLDVARLYTQLEFYRAKPRYRPKVMSGLQSATLEAFQPGLRPDHPLFAICALQHVVCHFLSHARQPGRFPASIYSAHLRRRHRRWMDDRMRASSAASTPAAAPVMRR